MVVVFGDAIRTGVAVPYGSDRQDCGEILFSDWLCCQPENSLHQRLQPRDNFLYAFDIPSRYRFQFHLQVSKTDRFMRPSLISNRMHLMFTLDDAGKRQYTLKKVVDAEITKSAHPARFSPDDKYSRLVKYDSDFPASRKLTKI